MSSATVTIYGEPIWDPVQLAGRMGGFGVVAALAALVIATLTTNLAANVVAPAYGFSNLAPDKISFRMGGYITASKTLVDVIRSYAPGFIFTTSLAPVLVAGALASIRHLKQSSAERDAQQAAATRLKVLMNDARLPVMDSSTHIVPLLIGDPVKAKKISDILLVEYGVYVQPINYPTVPRGSERLRFTPGPNHDEAMMQALVGALVEIWDRLAMKLAA